MSATANQQQCVAPGYGYIAQADFEGWEAGPKFGWTVTGKDDSAPGWESGDPGGHGNWVGSGGFATAVSDAHDGAAEDTYLTSPVFSLAGEKSADLQFDTVVYLPDGSAADVSLSTDNGATWTSLYERGSGDADMGHIDIPLTQALGQPAVRVRFHYKGQGGSLVQLDNVSVGSCRMLPGGLVEGIARDANTGLPVNGATVSDGAADVTALHASGGERGHP